jgi:hypothetical protein
MKRDKQKSCLSDISKTELIFRDNLKVQGTCERLGEKWNLVRICAIKSGYLGVKRTRQEPHTLLTEGFTDAA